MVNFKVLPGLPPYGPPPKQFGYQKEGSYYHSEGLVVEFSPDAESTWVGNFQPCGGNFSRVLSHPNDRHVIVIAGGQGYVVDPREQRLIECFGGQIETVIEVPEQHLLIFGNGLWFEAYGQAGPRWRSRRVSWDGMRNLRRDGNELIGEAWTPLDQKNEWCSFRVNVLDGTVQGGSYNGPD